MLELTEDQKGAVIRPFGGGLPTKGKKKKKPFPVQAAEPEVAPTNVLESPQPVEPAEPPPPKLVRPVFVMPAADSEVWDEVLTDVVQLRPPSVPVKVVFTSSAELPHWHEMPLDTPGLVAAASSSPAPASQPTGTAAGAPAHGPRAPQGPQHFLRKEDADLLPEWFQDMERPYLEAAARDALKTAKHHVLVALPVERMAGRTRRVAVLARKVLAEDGALLGYEYPQAGHEQMLAILPWTQFMPSDERNDVVRRLEALGRKLRRLDA